jgi:hypothetical protein
VNFPPITLTTAKHFLFIHSTQKKISQW